MACSLATTSANSATVTQPHSPDSDPGGSRQTFKCSSADIHTGRAFSDLSPAERDAFLGNIEMDFRRNIAETRSSAGFVFYPNTRQIMRAITSLYEALANMDFSDVFI
ncbi:hypothetical protein LPJ53_001774 [Coemansia erecta]|uniref:Uncharacterized protein n=1 Tax=Coemansia erecta TaxID=147472 RepID=A0A9W7Y2R0_9FUNG|nr:hypothetical protein LPJ53_001774 [Coemansia erecta]